MTPAEEREQERRQAVLAAIQRTKLMLRLERKQFADAATMAYEHEESDVSREFV